MSQKPYPLSKLLYSYKDLNMKTSTIECLQIHYIITLRDGFMCPMLLFSIHDMCNVRSMEYLPQSQMDF